MQLMWLNAGLTGSLKMKIRTKYHTTSQAAQNR